jgi:hypothetical protein
MRIKFSGPIARLEPILLTYSSPGTFSLDKTLYPNHTIYDIIVIGGGGGKGGTVHGNDPDNGWETYAFGGEGGGGGFHRMRGLTEFLDDSTALTVGDAGADGVDAEDDPTAATDGSDGGFSSFGDFIVASGGKGGYHPETLSANENQVANGNSGGFGARSTAGGGALGGTDGVLTMIDLLDGFPGRTGKLFLRANDIIGQGGGGGAGGAIALQDGDWMIRVPKATAGGRGSYDNDELVFAPGTPREKQTPIAVNKPYYAKAGRAGGARATPLNKSMISYGNSGAPGAVVILLSTE